MKDKKGAGLDNLFTIADSVWLMDNQQWIWSEAIIGPALKAKFRQAYNSDPAYRCIIRLLFPDGQDTG